VLSISTIFVRPDLFQFSVKRILILALSLAPFSSYAQELLNSATAYQDRTQSIALANEAQATNSNTSEAPSATTTQIAPETTAMSEVDKLARQQKAMAHLKAMLKVKEKKAPIKKVTPYEQLVKLAFKGKGENGINSYKDAAKQFYAL